MTEEELLADEVARVRSGQQSISDLVKAARHFVELGGRAGIKWSRYYARAAVRVHMEMRA